MNKKLVLASAFIYMLSISVLVGVQFVNLAEANFIVPPAKILIQSPINGTYNVSSVPLSLAILVPSEYGDSRLSWIVYDLDDKGNVSITGEYRGRNWPGRSALDWDYLIYTGDTILSGLSDGSHSLIVYAKLQLPDLFFSSTVYFTVDTTFPSISILSPENKTYTTTDIPLTFTLNETASWIGYCLDGQANVTITGNTTLTGLSYGSHNLVVYARDTAGNTGASETIYFSIKTEPFLTTWIGGAVVALAAGSGCLLLNVKSRLRHRKHSVAALRGEDSE